MKLNPIRRNADPTGDTTLCDHDWPPELTSDACCYNCGLPYDEWSE